MKIKISIEIEVKNAPLGNFEKGWNSTIQSYVDNLIGLVKITLMRVLKSGEPKIKSKISYED